MDSTRVAVIGATFVLGAALACSDAITEHVEHPFAADLRATSVTEVSRIGDGYADFMPEPVCKLAAWGTVGAGVFVVDRIALVDEETDDGGITQFAYVVFNAEEAWAPADLAATVVARTPVASTTGWDLEVGDRVVAFLRGGHDSLNEGFPWTASNRMYRASVSGRWLVHSEDHDTATLREAVQAAYDSFLPGEFSATECGIDVDFDECPPASMIPQEHFAFDEPCQE